MRCLFFATTINYIDRAVLSVLEPELEKVIGWTATQYGNINAAFTLAYAIGFLFAGWMMDKLGTRVGYALALIVWSLAAAGHAFADSVIGFAIARFALGIGESGNFPAAIKTVAEWFPKKERAFATGIFNGGSNVGAIIAPIVVPILFAWHGWQTAFIATGLAGLVWVFFWWPLYRRPQEHPRVSPAELAYIESDPPDPPVRVPWLDLLPFRQTWAFAIGKFLTDSIWWFYLFWFPKFMNDQFGVDIKTIGLPMITVYLLADVGSIAGGWQSSWLLERGWTANAARKTAMLTCAVCIVPVALRAAGRRQVGRRALDRHCRRRAPRILRQPVHAHLRHVSAARGRIGRRHRRFRRCDGRIPDESRRRPAQGSDRQLHRHVRRRRLRVSRRAA